MTVKRLVIRPGVVVFGSRYYAAPDSSPPGSIIDVQIVDGEVQLPTVPIVPRFPQASDGSSEDISA